MDDASLSFSVRRDMMRPVLFLVIIFCAAAYQLINYLPTETADMAGVGGAFLVLLLLLFVISNLGYRHVGVDLKLKRVLVTRLSLLGKRKTKTIDAQEFSYVMSYIDYVAEDPARPINRVELATKSKLSGVTLAEYAPVFPEQLLGPKAKWQESAKAAELRAKLAVQLAVEDLGFMGDRFLLNQL